MNLKNRLGRFTVSLGVIDAVLRGQTTETASLNALFGKCVVIDAETRYLQRHVEYTAYCADFDEVPEGVIEPWYDFEITRLEEMVGAQRIETYSVQFKRRVQS